MKKLFAILLIIVMFTGCKATGETVSSTQEPPSDPNVAVTEPESSDYPISFSIGSSDFDSEESLFAAFAREPESWNLFGLTEIYRPSVIPQGYELEVISVSTSHVTYAYSNNQGECIKFVWRRDIPAQDAIESRDAWLGRGETSHKKTKKNGVEYLFLRYNDSFFVAWAEDGKSFWADTTDDSITEQELLAFCKYEVVKVP